MTIHQESKVQPASEYLFQIWSQMQEWNLKHGTFVKIAHWFSLKIDFPGGPNCSVFKLCMNTPARTFHSRTSDKISQCLHHCFQSKLYYHQFFLKLVSGTFTLLHQFLALVIYNCDDGKFICTVVFLQGGQNTKYWRSLSCWIMCHPLPKEWFAAWRAGEEALLSGPWMALEVRGRVMLYRSSVRLPLHSHNHIPQAMKEYHWGSLQKWTLFLRCICLISLMV